MGEVFHWGYLPKELPFERNSILQMEPRECPETMLYIRPSRGIPPNRLIMHWRVRESSNVTALNVIRIGIEVFYNKEYPCYILWVWPDTSLRDWPGRVNVECVMGKYYYVLLPEQRVVLTVLLYVCVSVTCPMFSVKAVLVYLKGQLRRINQLKYS